ncbi:hypothetical protein CR513_29162, partial [Mucuna pruriens]
MFTNGSGQSLVVIVILVYVDDILLFDPNLRQSLSKLKILVLPWLGNCQISLPMDPNLKLNSTDEDPNSIPSMYKRLIGQLLYLTISRPDICFSIHKLSQHM